MVTYSRARLRPLVRHARLAHEPGLRRAAGSTSPTIATRRATPSTCSGCSWTRAWRSRGAIGVTGVSYGGIQSLNLARLRDRIRLRRRLASGPGRARTGTPLAIAAAYPRWAGSDLTYALQPNGRFLDFRTPRPARASGPAA